MSHLGTRLLALRFEDADEGIDSIIQEMTGVLQGGDALPVGATSIYDDTRHGWVAQSQGPVPSDDPVITFPLVRLKTMGVDYTAGVADVQSTGARTVSGTLRVMVQLILQGDDLDGLTAEGMYRLRAMRGVIARIDDPTNDTARTFGGVQLRPSTSIAQAQVDAPLGDTLISPGAFLITYPFIETVPLPLSLH